MDRASIGPYRVVERLGAGAMGEVYLAVDTRLGRRVALKSLSDPSLDAPHARERLLSEARAAAHITHPNIAAIYDILDTGEHPCIVMEYAQGEPLSSIASHGPMACREVMTIALQLVDAVGHAHAAGVIHRDLKPANIVLTPEGVVKVLDFGLAHIHDVEEVEGNDTAPTREVTRSHIGGIAGTPAYMAPELLVGRPASTLSDIYSLGATLYQLLAGRRPFDATKPDDLAWDIVSKPTPRVSEVVPSVPPALDRIVAKAMARDPEERYQSVAEMTEDLRQVERECRPGSKTSVERVSAEPAIDDARTSSIRARRLAVLVASLAALTLLVAVVVALRGREPAAPATSSQFVAVVPFTNESGDPGAAPEAAGLTEAVIAALEGLSSVSVLSTKADAARFAESPGDLRKRVMALGVTMVVSGSESRSGTVRRVTARVETPDGRPVSSGSYQGSTGDVAGLQARVVQEIVGALHVALTPADRGRLQRVPACLPDTYIALATGRAMLERSDVAGLPRKAEAVFRQAAAKDPACALAHAALAYADIVVYGEDKDAARMSDADRSIQEAYRLDPDSPAIRTTMATFYRRTGRPDQAEKVIRQVVLQRPFDDEGHRILSDVLTEQGRTEEAIAELRRAIDLRPNNVVNHVVLGNMHLDAGRYAEAAKSYEHVLALQPDNSWAASNVCAAYSGLSDFQRATECYRALPPDATNLTNLGASYYNLGRFQEAADACRRAVEMDPRSDRKRWNLADAYLRLGDKPRAVEQYRQAAELSQAVLTVNPQDSRAMARHAFYDARLGRADDAIRHAAAAVELSPRDSAVLYRRAVVHCVLNQPADAVVWLERALQAGYVTARARADTDLNPIRKLPKVEEMLKGSR
jgi:serine/threonine-protein kinase